MEITLKESSDHDGSGA